MDDVLTAYNNISPVGTREYYECNNPPTLPTGMIQSHFKGISAFAEKIIFSSPNIDIFPTQNGKYLIADKITNGNQGSTELTVETDHPGWIHPCSSQACGSFLALGIQDSADNPSKTSQIEIYDIRKTQINQKMTLLGVINRNDDGVNGIGMTREISGTYLVAGVNGNKLKVYRSSSNDLLGSPPVFTEIFYDDNFPESGSGLALITQKNGDIYLMALNANDDTSDNHIALFQLDFTNQKAVQVGSNRDMPVTGVSDTILIAIAQSAIIAEYNPALSAAIMTLLAFGSQFLSNSFRWGKGVNIRDSINLEVYASDRNVIPLSNFPVIGSAKDFSLVTWQSNAKRWPNNGIKVGIQTSGRQFLTAVNGGGQGGNVAISTDKTQVGEFEKFTIVVKDAVHGYFALQTCNGQYLTAVNGGNVGTDNNPIQTNKTVGGVFETFTLEEQPDQTFAIKTSGGFYLSAVNGGGNSDSTQSINTNTTEIKENEIFGFAVIN